jgi:hypothetical protein
MDAQRRATSGKPSIASATKKRALGSDAPGSSARGSEDRSSVAPPPPPRGTKRAREIEGIDKVCYVHFSFHRCRPKFFVVGRVLRKFDHATANLMVLWFLIITCALYRMVCVRCNDIFCVANVALQMGRLYCHVASKSLRCGTSTTALKVTK